MIILVKITLTEKGQLNTAEVIEEMDYAFEHPEIISTEIIDKIGETK